MNSETRVDIQRPGTAIMVYTDEGPNGPCGQSMSVTCPHMAVHVFRSETAMREFVDANPNWSRNGKRAKLWWVIVGETSTSGASLTVHE